MKVAVIGGGIFGCTAAIYAAREGHEVTLYERSGGLLTAASYSNQARLHRGYHYPRSCETIVECQNANLSFESEYGNTILQGDTSLYAIAAEGSKTSPEEYLKVCKAHGLSARITSIGEYLNPETVDMVIEAEEARIDLDKLKTDIQLKIVNSGVKVIFEPFSTFVSDKYDKVIVAAYGNNNSCLSALLGYDAHKLPNFQFEVIEKPIVKMPEEFEGVGVVVMDGEFCCVDPWGSTGYHALGHVKHSIWASNVGKAANVPYFLYPLLDRGVVSNPGYTKFGDIVENGRGYIPLLERAEHIGSMYTVRAVLPNTDATDARPTLIKPEGLDAKYIKIFSGKIGTAVRTAKRALEYL